jgi:uncharacterized protein YbjT (DUF2867 family)
MEEAVINLLVLGANVQLPQCHPVLLATRGVKVTLYVRRANRLANPDPQQVTVVDGEVLDAGTFSGAIKDQDGVYANLAGSDMSKQAQSILRSGTRAIGSRLSRRALWLRRSCEASGFR